MPTYVRVFSRTPAWMRFVERWLWNRQERKIQAKMAACDALEALRGGVAAYLNDTHGMPKTLCDSVDLLAERRIYILALLHAVRDSTARKYLENGLTEWLSSPIVATELRSGIFFTVHLQTPSTDETNS